MSLSPYIRKDSRRDSGVYTYASVTHPNCLPPLAMKKCLFGIVDLRMLQGQQSHQARSCIAGGVVGYTVGCDLVELPLCEEGGIWTL